MPQLTEEQRKTAREFIDAVRPMLESAGLGLVPKFDEVRAIVHYTDRTYNAALELAARSVVRWFDDSRTPSFDMLNILNTAANEAEEKLKK